MSHSISAIALSRASCAGAIRVNHKAFVRGQIVVMSHKFTVPVWKIPMKNAGMKVVAIALADYADKNGRCFPSVKSLAARCDLRTEAVSVHIRALERIGVILRRSNFKAGRQTSNVYQFALPDVLLGIASKIAGGEGGEFQRGGGERKSHPREPSLENRHQRTVKGEGGFSDWNPRRLPHTEDEMYEILESLGVDCRPDHDGSFFPDMHRNGWMVHGRPVADWVKLYQTRINLIEGGMSR
jgi:hypothetical protein